MRPLALAGALLVAILAAGQALPHAALTATQPPDGALLPSAPAELRLTFDDAVRPLVARLVSPDGRTRLLPPAQLQGASVIWPLALPEHAPQGSYVVSWRVTSEDGHALSGGTVFSVGAPSATGRAETATPLATRAMLWALRSVVVAALLLTAGGLAFEAFLGAGTARARRWIAALGLLALPAMTGFQGLDLLGLPPAAILAPEPWSEAAAGASGGAISLTALALVVALGHGPAAAIAALALTMAAAAVSGHAATAAPRLLMRPTVALHVLGAAAWIGALLPLAASLRRGEAAPLRRFTALAPAVVALLLASGAVLATVQLGHLGALPATAYGRVMLVKLALVAGMLALAAANRTWLARSPAALRRSIAVELGLGLMVIATLSLWRFTPPPRSLQTPAAAISQVITFPGSPALTARIRVTPPEAGPVSIVLEQVLRDGAPFAPPEMRIELSKPAYGLGPFEQELVADRPAGFILPLDGFWVARLTLRLSDFESREAKDIITLLPAAASGTK